MPKLFFLDTGLASYLLGYKKPDNLHTSPHYGPLLENFVITECLKQAAWADDEYRFWHFRDRARNEVDLVIENDSGDIVGVEVKASASIRRDDFKGLVHLADYARRNFRRGIVLYAGANLLPIRIAETTFQAVPLSNLLRPSLHHPRAAPG